MGGAIEGESLVSKTAVAFVGGYFLFEGNVSGGGNKKSGEKAGALEEPAKRRRVFVHDAVLAKLGANGGERSAAAEREGECVRFALNGFDYGVAQVCDNVFLREALAKGTDERKEYVMLAADGSETIVAEAEEILVVEPIEGERVTEDENVGEESGECEDELIGFEDE